MKRCHEFEKEGYEGRFGGRTGKGGLSVIISKNERN